MNREETKLLVEEWRNFINEHEESIESSDHEEHVESNDYKEAAETLLDFMGWIPGIGAITSFAQATKAFLYKDYFNTVCYLISMFPLKGKLLGKSAQTIKKILQPYYNEYKKYGKIDIDNILKNPEDDIINVAMALTEFKLKVKPIYRLLGGKKEVSENATSGLEEFFDFLQVVIDTKKDKESMGIENEPDTLGT